MAQEANQGQAVQTQIHLKRPYRETGAGGFTKSYVLTPSGVLVRPSIRYRSRSGSHGWDGWVLGLGRYVLITIDRPNINGKPKPYTVAIQCIDTTTGKVNTIAERRLYIMDWSLENVKTWAKAICP